MFDFYAASFLSNQEHFPSPLLFPVVLLTCWGKRVRSIRCPRVWNFLITASWCCLTRSSVSRIFYNLRIIPRDLISFLLPEPLASELWPMSCPNGSWLFVIKRLLMGSVFCWRLSAPCGVPCRVTCTNFLHPFTYIFPPTPLRSLPQPCTEITFRDHEIFFTNKPHDFPSAF